MNFKGWTLVEIVIVVGLAGILFMIAAPLIRHMGRGTVTMQKTMDQQRNVRTAMNVLQRDLLSSRPGTVTNLLPNGDFEDAPSPEIRSPNAQWILPTPRPGLIPERFAQAGVRAHPDFVKTGQWGLLFTATGIDCSVKSQPIVLSPGDYLLGGWVKSFNRGAARPAALRLLPTATGESTPRPPVADVNGFSPGKWTFLSNTVKISEKASFQVELGFDGMTSDPENKAMAAFDGVALLPLATELNPDDGNTISLDCFETEGPDEGKTQRVHYRLASEGASGVLIRETVSPTGTTRDAEFPHIRRLRLARDFFQDLPGVLPDPLPDHFFAEGFSFPIVLTLETSETGESSQGGALAISVREGPPCDEKRPG